MSSMVQSIAVGEPSSSSAMIVSTETEYRGPLLTVILDTASGAGLRKIYKVSPYDHIGIGWTGGHVGHVSSC